MRKDFIEATAVLVTFLVDAGDFLRVADFFEVVAFFVGAVLGAVCFAGISFL